MFGFPEVKKCKKLMKKTRVDKYNQQWWECETKVKEAYGGWPKGQSEHLAVTKINNGNK